MRRFFASKGGTAGVALLALFVLTGVLGPFFVPYPEAATRWRDISFWQDSPPAAPPAWTVGPRAPVAGRPLEDSGTRVSWSFEPAEGQIVVLVPGEGPIPVRVSSEDDRGEVVELDRRLANPASGQPVRISLNVGSAKRILVTELKEPSRPTPPVPSLVVIAKTSGLLGTDTSKRDVFTGVVLGVRWALILGLLVSFLTVVMGLLLGILAACSGGWIDVLLNRVYEFFLLMPLLPLLIVLSTVYKPSLWSFMALALLFFWTKAFKPVYAMALQIRNEVYVEAGRTVGAGRWRLATRYVLPALLPYGFAIMALSVPGIILYEASISLLGLGDTSTVTWGQMLHDAFAQGAVINRLWWWVIPPGVMVALTGLTFALLGRGFERVWNPSRR
jgi:peptide/nickel transport system permease protein